MVLVKFQQRGMGFFILVSIIYTSLVGPVVGGVGKILPLTTFRRKVVPIHMGKNVRALCTV